MRKQITYCVEHEMQAITYFCCSQRCLLPMCDICLRIHKEEHKEFKVDMEINSIEKVVQQTYRSIAQQLREVQEAHTIMEEYRSRFFQAARIAAQNARLSILKQVDEMIKNIQKSLQENHFLECLKNNLKILQTELQLTERQLKSQRQCKGVILFKQRGRRDLDYILKEISNLISQPINLLIQNHHLKINLDYNESKGQFSNKLKFISEETNRIAQRIRA